MSAASVAQIVKNETAISHQEVEALMLPRLQQISSQQDYVRILQMFYGFYLPMEEAIHSRLTADEVPDIAERRTASLILQDLKTLGHENVPDRIATVPEIVTVPQAFGALYVLEGSTLGGKIIAKMLAKNNQVSLPQEALHFFLGYGEKTGPMWTSFVQVLNQQTDAASITAAANQTFLSLKHWMHSYYETATEL